LRKQNDVPPYFSHLSKSENGEEARIKFFLGFQPAQDKVGQRHLYHFVYPGRYIVDVTFLWQCNFVIL
jgi:hypothetical protein